MSDQNGEEDLWAKVTKAVDDLYNLRDTYFPANPDEKVFVLQKESDLALNLLDSIPFGTFFFNFNRNLLNSCF